MSLSPRAMRAPSGEFTWAHTWAEFRMQLDRKGHSMSARPSPSGAERPSSLRLILAILGTAMAIALEAVGFWHLIVWREWRGGTSLGFMVLGCFLLMAGHYVAND
jgi:hypothetical protein